MSITIYEGVLTSIEPESMYNFRNDTLKMIPALHVKFPITSNDDISIYPPCDGYKSEFKFCVSARDVEEILVNMIINSTPIWNLYNLGYNIHIRNFAITNILCRIASGSDSAYYINQLGTYELMISDTVFQRCYESISAFDMVFVNADHKISVLDSAENKPEMTLKVNSHFAEFIEKQRGVSFRFNRR